MSALCRRAACACFFHAREPATVHLEDSWVSQAQAQADLQRYPLGNRTACFCPLVEPNLFAHPESWSIYRFCLLDFSSADVARLLAAYWFWLDAGIALTALGSVAMTAVLVFYIRTRCFKRRFRCLPRGRYAPINR